MIERIGNRLKAIGAAAQRVVARSRRLSGFVIGAALSAFGFLAVAVSSVNAFLHPHPALVTEGTIGSELVEASPRLPMPAAVLHHRRDERSPPIDAVEALSESNPAGLVLPRISAEGKRPLDVYRRMPPRSDKARIAILITELGLLGPRSDRAISLPLDVGLVYSPIAHDPATWQRNARASGFETFLELPLRPARSGDTEPLLLDLSRDADILAADLETVLSRGSGYPAVVLAGERVPKKVEPLVLLARQLRSRGLGLVELGSSSLETLAEAEGLPYISVARAIDPTPSTSGIDWQLGQLESEALGSGHAIAFARSLPLTMERLWLWAQTLESKGIDLVPVTSLFHQPAG